MNENSLLPRIERNSNLSRTFSALKWILALLVVCDHFFRVALLPYADTKSITYSQWLSDFVGAFIRDYQVPLFFMMSGFLFCASTKFSPSLYRNKIRSRLISLGIPYVVFILYAIAITAWLDYKYIGGPSWTLCHPMYMVTGHPLTYPINVPLWYLRDLLAMCLISPLIHAALRMTRGWIILPLVCIYVYVIPSGIFSHMLCSVTFFTAGYWLRLKGTDVTAKAHRMLPWLIPFYIILSTIQMNLAEDSYLYIWVKHLDVLVTAPMTFAIVSLLVERRKLPQSEFLVAATFFVYLTHHPLRRLMLNLFGSYAPGIGDIAFIPLLILSTAAMVLVLMLTFRTLSTVSPGLTAFITGSRVPSESSHNFGVTRIFRSVFGKIGGWGPKLQ